MALVCMANERVRNDWRDISRLLQWRGITHSPAIGGSRIF